jgi:hypothetical protein
MSLSRELRLLTVYYLKNLSTSAVSVDAQVA